MNETHLCGVREPVHEIRDHEGAYPSWSEGVNEPVGRVVAGGAAWPRSQDAREAPREAERGGSGALLSGDLLVFDAGHSRRRPIWRQGRYS